MKAVYVCPKCKALKETSSIGTGAHFKRQKCDKCNVSMHLKETKE